VHPVDSFQDLTAAGGHAYGVIDADLHVIGNPQVTWAITEWTGESGRPPAGSTGDLAALRQWRDAGPRLSTCWLSGPDSGRRDQVMAHFSSDTRLSRWKVAKVVRITPEIRTIRPVRTGADHTGVLLVVGSADQWPLPDLTWLFSDALLHQDGQPARVLLTAGTARNWNALRAALANHAAGTLTHPVPS
jgi:hypothetical protein